MLSRSAKKDKQPLMNVPDAGGWNYARRRSGTLALGLQF
jgi:hypothetical protein